MNYNFIAHPLYFISLWTLNYESINFRSSFEFYGDEVGKWKINFTVTIGAFSEYLMYAKN